MTMACFPNGWNRLPAGKIRHLAGFRSHLQRVTSPGFDRNRKPWPTHVPHQSHSARNKSLHFVACPKPGGRKRIAQRFIAGLAHPSVTSPVRDERIVCVPTPPAPCFGLRPSRRDLVAQVSQPAASPLQRCSAYGKTPAFISNQHAGMNAKGVPSFSPGLRASATLGNPPHAFNPERVASVSQSFANFLFPLRLRQNRPERTTPDRLGQRPGYGPVIKIQRCQRAKIQRFIQDFCVQPFYLLTPKFYLLSASLSPQ